MAKNPVDWFVGLLLLVISFVVVDVMVGGAIEEGLQRAADQLGTYVPILPLAVAIIIFVGGVLGLIAFVGGLKDHLGL